MRALTRQLSAAAALAVLFLQLLSGTSLEHALVTAAVVAGAVTFVLAVVGSSVRRAQRAATSARPSGADPAR